MVARSLDPAINDMRTAKRAAVNGMLLKVCFQAIGGRTPMTDIGRVAADVRTHDCKCLAARYSRGHDG